MRRFINWIKKIFGFGSAQVPQSNSSVGAPVTIPLGSDVSTPDIKLGKVVNATDGEVTMIARAVSYAARVIYSDQFKQEVLNSNFTSTDGLTNLEIYEKFTTSTITINVSMFYGSYMQNKVWKTQGYEQGDGFVYANRYFINNSFDMASLILHECAHQLGFHHESASEHTSVPYKMNEIFIKVAGMLGIK